jgi:hypothetical protein
MVFNSASNYFEYLTRGKVPKLLGRNEQIEVLRADQFICTGRIG